MAYSLIGSLALVRDKQVESGRLLQHWEAVEEFAAPICKTMNGMAAVTEASAEERREVCRRRTRNWFGKSWNGASLRRNPPETN